MNEHDPFVRDEKLGDQFTYHVLDVPGPTWSTSRDSYRPEVVLFGKDQQFQLPLVLDAGQVDPRQRHEAATRSRSAGSRRRRSRSSASSRTSVDEVIRAIVELGGTYPDVVQALQQAKQRRRSRQPLRGRCAAGIGPAVRPQSGQRQGGRRATRPNGADEQDCAARSRDAAAGFVQPAAVK